MEVILPDNLLNNFPQVHKDDLLITAHKGDHSGYYWSDSQCVKIEQERRKGLQVMIDEETRGLRVLTDWPQVEIQDIDYQMTIEDYLKQKENNKDAEESKSTLKVKLQTDNNS